MRTWTALLLASALIVCGTALVAVTAGDEADGTDMIEYTKVFKTNGPETVSIDTYESDLDSDPSVESYQVGWSYHDGNGWRVLTLDNEFNIGDWSYRLTRGSDGIYDMTMSTPKISSETELRLSYTAVISYKPETGRAATTETTEIVIKVSKSGSALPATISRNYFELAVDTAISETDGKIEPEDETGAPVPNDFNWFAFDLPDGVSMTADGHLSGIPKRTNNEPVLYTVYAENTFGSIEAYSIYIRVFERDESPPEFWVHSGDMAGFDPDTSYTSPKISAVQHGDAVHLVVSKDAPSLAGLNVSVVDPAAPRYRRDVEPQDAGAYLTYSLPSEVTGAYGVIIEFGTNVTRTLVYVLPQLDVVIAGIGVVSSSTAVNP